NCFAQVYGRKSFTLFDPMQTEFLYPFPADTSLGHLSSVDIEMPDFTKHAKFRRARPMQCVIGPGELLYLPSYWWHQVRSLEVAISVSFWWPPQFQQRLLPNALRVLPSLYKKDCLASLKGTLVASSGLSFVEVAELLSRLEIRWASVLLAGAAFEERLRQLPIARGFPEKREGLSGASSRANAMKRYSSKEVQQIEALDAAVVKALTASNDQFTDAEVASLIEGVRSLILR
ncbi:MAG: cupin-like domain-containing protein, partial [Blastocatellia bacterium]